MTPTYSQYQKNSPCRAPTWRWEPAHHLVGQGRSFTRRRDDAATGRAVHYLRVWNHCRSERQQAKVAQTYPDLHAARQLQEQGNSTRAEVQARLLARQTSEEIARLTAVSAAVIDTYEALFFSIKDRLDARDWVTAKAIGRSRMDPAQPDPAVVLKSFAYFGGPLVLEAVLPYLTGQQDGGNEVNDLSTPEGRQAQSTRLAIAVELLPQGAENDWKLQKIDCLLVETAHRRPKTAVPTGILGRNMGFLFQERLLGPVPETVPAPFPAPPPTAPEVVRQVG